MNQPPLDPSQFWFSTHDGRLSLYESSWGVFAEKFRALAATGMSMAEFVGRLDQALDIYRGFVDPDHLAEIPQLDFGAFAKAPAPARLAVENGKYVVVAEARRGFDVLLQMVDRALGADADCVVECGSGLGSNLARLRLRHPGRDLTYIACEPTAAGRACATALFSTDPAMRTQVRAFDYGAPDLAFLAEFRRPVIFTNHSIEQVPLCGPFYERLLASNVAACVHVEPVGWQRFTNVVEVVATMYRDKAVFLDVLERYRWVVDDARLVDNAAMWAAHYQYNLDLLQQVATAGAGGRIALFALGYDVHGHNPFNPSTVIGWSRRS